MNKVVRIFFLLVVVIGCSTGLCRADEVTDWNADPSWMPLLTTPAYPDYPSELLGVSSAGVAALVHFFGANSSFEVPTDSTAAGLAGVTRSFSNFSSALDEVVGAPIWAGIHFRAADEDSRQLGTTIGNYIIANAFQRH